MYRKLIFALYYAIFYNLPHSRFIAFSNKLRVWYVSKVLKLMPYDSKTKLEYGVYLSNGKGTKIGRNCRINENVFIQEAKIGNHVLIAPNVAILSVSHAHKDVAIPIVEQGDTSPKPPLISDNVWLGRNVIIMPGVTIGANSIVGAGAVVTKDVPENVIVGGVPAKLIRTR